MEKSRKKEEAEKESNIDWSEYFASIISVCPWSKSYWKQQKTQFVFHFQKDWLAIATLKPTFTFLGRDFAIFNTFTWQNPYQKSESWF